MLLLVDADSCQEMLAAIAKTALSPFPCFSAGIFSRTTEWCPGEPFYFQPSPSLPGRARIVLGKAKRWLLGDRSPLQKFFEDVVENGCVLNRAIVKDERILHHKGPPYIWMPDIFEDSAESISADVLEAEASVSTFLEEYEAKDSREILLFYGSGAWYKGYDYFLKLAEQDSDVIALHVGASQRDEHGKTWDFDIESLRETLLSQDRLLETSVFASPAITHKAFSKIRRFVSFHRLSGSSGTVLQALSHSKPVLTPGAGLIGYRTRTHALGLTYRALEIEDLLDKWTLFKKIPTDHFKQSIARYSENFSQAAIEKFVDSLLTAAQDSKN